MWPFGMLRSQNPGELSPTLCSWFVLHLFHFSVYFCICSFSSTPTILPLTVILLYQHKESSCSALLWGGRRGFYNMLGFVYLHHLISWSPQFQEVVIRGLSGNLQMRFKTPGPDHIKVFASHRNRRHW